jgi:hypothetical protein
MTNARERAAAPGSMWSGVILGGTGIGKSRVDRRRLVWRIASTDCDSTPCDDATAAMTATTPKSAVQLLRWVDGVRDFRARHLVDNARSGRWKLELIVVVDEAAEVLADSTYGAEASRLIADIMRRGRSVGVGCVFALDGDRPRLPASLRDAEES